MAKFVPKDPFWVKIVDIGSSGDGVAFDLEGNKVFVPFGLPDDEMLVQRQKGWIKVLLHKKLSSMRAPPICPLAGVCGGCALPELKKENYLSLKNKMVTDTLSLSKLAAKNIEPMFAPLTLGIRRRASFSYRLRDKMELGFNRKDSHFVEDMQSCPLLVSEINNILAPLKDFLTKLDCKKGSLNITLTNAGLDILINDVFAESLTNLELISNFAATHKIARISDKFKNVLIEREPPYVTFEKHKVAFPPFSFLQPSEMGENFIREKIISYISAYAPDGAKNFADLFCGLGTFSFSLAKLGKTFACDDNKAAINSFTKTASTAGLPINVAARNLFTSPLTPSELKAFDVIVLDPPRAGAKEQIEQIAKSDKSFLIIYVSCNEATFGRDGKMLTDAGYELLSLAPLDQFPYTAHIELIGVFKKS